MQKIEDSGDGNKDIRQNSVHGELATEIWQ